MATEVTYHVTALERGLTLLSAFQPGQPPLRLTELARLASLPASTAHRLLRTLQSLGYVQQDETGRYSPAGAVLTLGFSALQANDAVHAAERPLQALSRRTGETTNFGVRLGDRVLYLVRFRTKTLNVLNIHPGSTLPLESTSMGKVLLAFGDSGSEDRSSPIGGRDDRELAAVRMRRWAVQDRELASNVRSVAVPVWSGRGLEGAINIVVDPQRYTREQMIEQLLPQLRSTASEISLRLGYLDMVLHAEESSYA